MQRFTLAGTLVLLALVSSPASAQSHDVIVGDLLGINSYGSENGIYAYSVGTESCNIGTVGLDWQQNTPLHPVIGQEAWRLKDGVLEQIGISWLKHSFCALDLNLCDTCQITNDCAVLGVGCSDPYGPGLNGQQNNLGPRSEVNAFTGVFPYPPGGGLFGGVIDRRLQIHEEDINPNLNDGALYFVTSHYVTQDDAQDGNGTNNSSYRQVVVDPDPSVYALTNAPGSATQQQSPGIQAWQDYVPTVDLIDVNIPNEGLLILGANVTDNGNGTWHYEYAIYNMNSDRSVGGFSVAFPGAATITNISMRDVDHHSGEPYDGTDWPGVFTPGFGVSWETTPFSQNPDANAIRWSTMYNFRFDADAPPVSGTGTIELFKPGTPNQMSVALPIPNGSTVPPITGFSCVPGSTTVELDWANGALYDSIEVRRDGTLLATLPGTATSFSDAGVPAGQHDWTLQAFQGTDPSNYATCSVQVTLRSFGVPDLSAFAGQLSLTIPVELTNSTPVEGFSVSLTIPVDRITVNAVGIDGTITDASGAEFVDTSFGASFVTAEVVLDAVGPFAGQTIPSGTEQAILEIDASVSSAATDGETRTFDFVDGLGTGIENSVRIGGIDQTPVVESGTITFSSSPTFKRGDCNGDNGVGIADAIFGLNYMFAGGAVPNCLKACDFDDAGNVNLADAINLLNFLFLPGQTPPAMPFPDPGPDPTPDGLPCS